MAKGGYDPMRQEEDFQNPVYDDDEWEYDETSIDNPIDIPEDPISTKAKSPVQLRLLKSAVNSYYGN